MIGSTDPSDATPGSIRGQYAQEMSDNIIHGSDSDESADREVSLWFATDELF